MLIIVWDIFNQSLLINQILYLFFYIFIRKDLNSYSSIPLSFLKIFLEFIKFKYLINLLYIKYFLI